MRDLEQQIDQGARVDFTTHPVHDLTGVMKTYLRSLPTPLILADLYDAFVLAAKLENPLDRQRSFLLLLSLLPTTHRSVLEMLLEHFHRVTMSSKHAVRPDGTISDGNHMDSHNLALILGPSFMRRPPSKSKSATLEMEDMSEQLMAVDVVKHLIDLGVDAFLVRYALQLHVHAY
jgi:hypothetical protein